MNIYVDHSATTPVDPRVLEAMLPYYQEYFYNPSSLYPNAKKVRADVEKARAIIADYINCSPDELLFTSGGTEADNLAVLGVVAKSKRKKIITSIIEHHAVLACAERLKENGYTVIELPTGNKGYVEPKALEEAMDDDVALVSMMWANNETGIVQPIEELVKIAHRHGAIFHSDAVQAIGTQVIDVKKAGVDILCFSSHKIYGPKGSGVCYIREGVPFEPRNIGGQQEGFNRGGTENVACIIGMGRAVELLKQEREERCLKLAKLSQQFRDDVLKIDGIRVNTPIEGVIPGVINISCKDAEAEPLMILLGKAGIMASMGAACNSTSVEPSYVLKALGVPDDYIRGSLRISFGKDSTEEMPSIIATELETILKRIRK